METNKSNEEKQERRKYAKAGSRSGKMISFRCDYDCIKILESCKNKGRLINELIKEYGARTAQSYPVDEDADPDENNIDYNMP